MQVKQGLFQSLPYIHDENKQQLSSIVLDTFTDCVELQVESRVTFVVAALKDTVRVRTEV